MFKLLFVIAASSLAFAADTSRDTARSVLKELIEINTTDSSGDNTAAARAVAARLKAAGYTDQELTVFEPFAKKGGLVVRLRGSGRAKPILFIAHLDVVEAKPGDWTTNPFQLVEKDGYFYGRGTQDIKGEASLLITNFIRLKQEKFQPERDLIMALTADEEGGSHNGIEWLLKNRRDLIDAEYCINLDAGGGQARDGKKALYAIQAAEKGYLSFTLTAREPGATARCP